MAGNRYKINDISILYTRAQWEKLKPLFDNETANYKVFVSNRPDGIRLDVRVLVGELPILNGFVLSINNDLVEKIVPHYLGFELMSIAGNVAL